MQGRFGMDPTLLSIVVGLLCGILYLAGRKRLAVPLSLAVAILALSVGPSEPGTESEAERAKLPDFKARTGRADQQAELSDSPFAFAPLTKAERAALRKEYPFESVADRLGSAQTPERLRRTGIPSAESNIKSDTSRGGLADSWERLKTLERVLARDRRTDALQLLHSESVDAFARQPGFGGFRMSIPANRPAASDLAATDSEEVPLIGKVVIPYQPDFYEPPGVAPGPAAAGHDQFWDVHFRSQFEFFHPRYLGFAKDRDHVAGFRPHGFRPALLFAAITPFSPGWNQFDPRSIRQEPTDEREKTKPLWQLRRLELVSLLNFDKPAVYVSDRLPSMKKARQLSTRPLDAFESTALPSLQAGEDIVPVIDGEQLRVLGSIRAGERCVKCHAADRGDLLGAFTYTLVKERP
jgi:hypothetical protein